MKRIILLIIAFFTLAGVAHAAYPAYQGYVNDFANVLSPEAEKRIETKLADEDKKTSHQIAVATVKTTEPEQIEEYSIHLADQWKPGVKGKDNGVIMLFAMDDRKMRIEVGRGLEDDLTDLESSHVLDDIVKPEFRAGNYDAGVEKGVDAVILAIATADETASASAATTDGSGALLIILIVVAVIIFILWLAYSEYTPLGGEGDNNVRGIWVPKKGSKYGSRSIGKIERESFIPIIPPVIAASLPKRESSYSPSRSSSDDDSSSGSSWGGISFGGGSFAGGGATSSW